MGTLESREENTHSPSEGEKGRAEQLHSPTCSKKGLASYQTTISLSLSSPGEKNLGRGEQNESVGVTRKNL